MTYIYIRYIIPIKENERRSERMPEVTITAFKCERCEHIWLPKSDRRPTICPKCKSPYWDKPRLRPAKVKIEV